MSRSFGFWGNVALTIRAKGGGSSLLYLVGWAKGGWARLVRVTPGHALRRQAAALITPAKAGCDTLC